MQPIYSDFFMVVVSGTRDRICNINTDILVIIKGTRKLGVGGWGYHSSNSASFL